LSVVSKNETNRLRLSNFLFPIREDSRTETKWLLGNVVLDGIIFFSESFLTRHYEIIIKNSAESPRDHVLIVLAEVMEKKGYFRLAEPFIELGCEYGLL